MMYRGGPRAKIPYMVTLDVSIGGMHCEPCVQAVDVALAGLAGVSEYAVQIGKAEVVADAAATGRRDLFAAIRVAGALEDRGFTMVDPLG